MNIDDPISFTIAYDEARSTEDYEVYSIIIFPDNDNEKTPYVVCVLPIDRETLGINVVDVSNNVMPMGVNAKYKENEDHVIAIESIKDIIVPRMILIMTMTITGYNFLFPEEQLAVELEEKLTVATEELPEGEAFEFNDVEEFLKFTEGDDNNEGT